MLAKHKIHILLISFILTLISFILKSNDIEKIQIIKDNYYIGSLKLTNYKEKDSLIKEKKASYYILNFLQKKVSDIRVITISQDKDLSTSIDFFKKNKYKQLEKYYDKDKSILSTFSIRGLPTTFIANKDFKVFAKVEGVIEWKSKEFINWLYSN